MASEIVEEDSSQSSEDRLMPDGNSLYNSFDYYDYGQTGLGNQGLQNQGFVNQGLVNQGLVNQGLGNQGLGNQGLGNQGLLNQGLGYQSLQGLLGNTRLVNQNQLQNAKLLKKQNILAQNGLLNQQQQPLVQNRLNYVDYGNYDYGGPLIYTVGAYGGSYCREDQVNIGVLVATVAGIGLMFYTLLTKIQANGGRYLRPPSLVSIDAFDRIYESK